jgi:hypothetical protein
MKNQFFIAGDRALCVESCGRGVDDAVTAGTLYLVHAVTSTSPQFIFTSPTCYGWSASRFQLVRPKTGQTRTTFNPDTQ